MTSVLIVILDWNGIEDIEKCIDSLLLQDYKDFKILIVDNGSVDDLAMKVKKIVANNPDLVNYIPNPHNLSFAGDVNTGIKYAFENNYDTVALFNNDAKADPNWLSNLVKNGSGWPALKGVLASIWSILYHDLLASKLIRENFENSSLGKISK